MFRTCTTACRIILDGWSTIAVRAAVTWSFSLNTALRAFGCVVTISKHCSAMSWFGMYVSEALHVLSSKRLGIITPMNFVT